MALVYIYQADVYCLACGKKIREDLTAQGKAPADPDNESSYDSDDFPKGPCDEGEADSPSHCGAGEDCVNAIWCRHHGMHNPHAPDGKAVGHKLGAWLETDLTAEGRTYVAEAIREDRNKGGGRGCVSPFWAEWYADEIDLDDSNENEEGTSNEAAPD